MMDRRRISQGLLAAALMGLGPARAISVVPTGTRVLSSGYLPQSSALFAAMNNPPSVARKRAIDSCIRALVAGGVWSNLDALYVPAAADSQAALLNWKNPGTYNLTAVNGPTFMADQGFTGASTKYLDTGFNPTTAVGANYTRNSAHLGAWSLTATAKAADFAGLHDGGGTGTYLSPRWTDDKFYGALHGAELSASNTDGSGLYLASRTDANTVRFDKNGVQTMASGVNASAAPFNGTVQFLTADTAYWNGQCAAACFGGGLSVNQSLALYNALHVYLQTVAGVA